ncbi:hypothetical protein HBI56_079430 [Parastagonospora nodorum]|uniref:DUF1993 domain-containing protein n=2 Tax=Phaeosphaeria nodorum (strain SN15 / ATCC MYA-4574 / FGSC 10173) TaxID=321614 RepID=A0A7U2FGQ5_PHANO|nr:hypothetical protein SNOG_10815 [Parastagonospora nodorum SN15]KAH3913757.1 hypothetical protein HBH56_107340 [Parastagonospora nodorum]EAT82209.1 hypothetical protein SNOG_10815 [Parastagonospora nodorum SN15]KAH3929297.1 hypothetical protein HBH54_123080 [Parastagonospora nodorum]KAH3951677.1 hypothetical protein HBH53_057050 [Parastagonospora nodorum]KAH3975277.1 hypothetical protein HBH52_129710 [Parastagonospora nodorum]
MSNTLSFHHIALSPLLQGLRAAHHFLQKAQTHCQAQSDEPSTYLNASLHPEMKDLIYQVQRFTDAAKFVPCRVNPDIEGISLPDTETNFEELFARVQKVIGYLEKVDERQFEGKEGEEVVVQLGKREWRGKKGEYVLQFAQPNFWFHVTTTYAILRMKGVDVGKLDFLTAGKPLGVEKKEE